MVITNYKEAMENLNRTQRYTMRLQEYFDY